jgi:serine/threonine-protein kinase RsbW
MAEKTKTVIFPSSVDYLEKIEQISSDFATAAGFDESTVDDLSIALTELVNNAIHHGNKNDVNKKVSVTFINSTSKITISISDEGGGFIPSELNDPLHPDNLMSDNGRGIYLVNELMDEVNYKITDKGTEVIIIKNK